eukprot:m.385968 g.385968  ORF g.385968 m.385968 type:complete len:208 (+) comp16744_c0_seq14:1076-1699(+)
MVGDGGLTSPSGKTPNDSGSRDNAVLASDPATATPAAIHRSVTLHPATPTAQLATAGNPCIATFLLDLSTEAHPRRRTHQRLTVVLPTITRHSGPATRTPSSAAPHTAPDVAPLSTSSDNDSPAVATRPTAHGPKRSSASPPSGATTLAPSSAPVLRPSRTATAGQLCRRCGASALWSAITKGTTQDRLFFRNNALTQAVIGAWGAL